MTALHPSRRGILAAFAAAPALALPIVPALASSRHRWDRLEAEWRAASAAVLRFDAKVYTPAGVRLDKLMGSTPIGSDEPECPAREAYMTKLRKLDSRLNIKQLEVEFDRLAAIEADAENALIAEPAPDAAALSRKLLIAVREGEQMQSHHHEAILRDAHRFAGDA